MGDDSVSVAALEQRVETAVTRRDAAFLDSVWAPTFRFTHAGGTVQTRAKLLSEFRQPLRSDDTRTLAREVDSLSVEMHQNSAVTSGIIRVRQCTGATYRGYMVRFIRVYRRSDAGHWQLLSHHTVAPTEPEVPPKAVDVRQLAPDDVALMEALLTTFGEAFNEVDAYTEKRPGQGYLRRLLGGDSFIALAALKRGDVVGGIAAYELQKFEQERSEIYIYDLAVGSAHRREGIATALIEALKKIAAGRGAYVIFVEADTGIEDKPAIALYTKLGTREDVAHFDIPVEGQTSL